MRKYAATPYVDILIKPHLFFPSAPFYLLKPENRVEKNLLAEALPFIYFWN
jgi:hypothetical protein